MIAVSNTTPLIGFAAIEHFDLLKQLFGQLYIPQGVHDEIMKGRDNSIGTQELTHASWINTVSVKDRLAVDVLLDELDLGEAETIVLGCELNADWVLMDEKKGRRKLTQLGVPKIGTIGLLLKAKQNGLVPVIRPLVEQLHEKGFSLSPAVMDGVLRQAGE